MITRSARQYLTLSICMFLSVASVEATAGATMDKIRDNRTLVIAHREASVPFSYVDTQNKPIGYAVELCQKIAVAVKREMKLPLLNVEYVAVTSPTRISSIVEGKADLECGSTTNNAERRKVVAFTIPHFVAAVRMLVRTDSGLKNWSDLRGRTVVSTKGTTTVKLLTERDKVRALTLKLIEAADTTESFKIIENGKADVFPMDDVLLFGLRANATTPRDFLVTGDPLSAEPYAIMMRKDDPEFKEIVDREMARIINDGEMVKMYDRWFKSPIPPKNINMNMPMSYLLRDIFRFPSDKVGD